MTYISVLVLIDMNNEDTFSSLSGFGFVGFDADSDRRHE